MNVCLPPCTVNEAIPLEPWVDPSPPSGGSVTTANSLSVTFTGDGTAANPLTAEVAGDIQFEIASARTGSIGESEVFSAYSSAGGFTMPADQSGASVAAYGLTASLHLGIIRGNATSSQQLVGEIEIDPTGGMSVNIIAGVDAIFDPGDVMFLETQVGNGAADFIMLAITLIGVRPIKFV